ncbi:MAG: DUF364 domain-containing protein [Acidobacteriota bacterium]|nr:DUF364 domain-containing protein [Acidobacteriota bacterium]
MKEQQTSSNPMIESILTAVNQYRSTQTLDVRIGPFWSVVNTSVGAGMASTMRSQTHVHGAVAIAGAGSLAESTPVELAALLRSGSAPEAAVGLAAANALLSASARDLSVEKALAVLEKRCAGQRVAMIGRFPFAERLREHCAQLWVFERGLDRREGDFGEEAMEQLLPQAEVVAVTATTLLNRTLPGVLACARPDAFLMMLGPSTPLTPALFEFGFDILCGTVVEDPESVLKAAGEGAVTSQIKGVRRVSLWKA